MTSRCFDLNHRLGAELVGSALLAATVVGSGLMAERLAGGNVAIALLANSLATGAGLFAFITALGPVSGAHFNPAVSFAFAALGRLRWNHALAYAGAQVLGMVLGVLLVHAMFGLPLLQASTHVRQGGGLWIAEAFGTFTLLLVILLSERYAPERTPLAVAGIVTAGYWFTASTFFTNPALTIARALTDTFAGIRPHDAPAFIGMQCLGAALAVAAFRTLPREAHP